jgi:acyl-CoA synthetase (AMP-forming)/AMP-acid ligase II
LESRSFAQVALGASRAAAFLHGQGLRQGNVLALMGTHHIDLYAVWLGCLWLGVIPTILAEPSVRVDKEVYWARLAELFARIDARALAVAPTIRMDHRIAGVPSVHRYDEIAASAAPVPRVVVPGDDDVMVLQHSSGTTGLNKGVMLSHGAVLRHAESYLKTLEMSSRDVIASWLPLYHDMGLIACLVNPLIVGAPVVWISPFEWVISPGILLQAITQFRCTLAWLPNFAFSLLAQRVQAEPQKYDLSSLRRVINCSEPVRPESMRLFGDHFRSCGLNSAALHACYAMAENVFAISASTSSAPPRERRIDRNTWQNAHVSSVVPTDHPAPLLHISNGPCIEGCEVRIVDESGNQREVGAAGRILVRSSFLFSGYHQRDDLNRGLFDPEGFFDTGDVGYLDLDGHVYVTGRSKDLIIVGGKNIYPQDVEAAVGELEHIRPGRVACFGVPTAESGTEGLVVLAESDAPQGAWPELENCIRRTVAVTLDLDVMDTHIVPQDTLRKSTSGKMARGSNREWYVEGRFGPIPSSKRAERS